MEAAESRKRKLDLDWNRLLSKDAGDGEPPPSLVVIKAEPQPPPRKSDASGGCDDQGKEEFWENLTDVELEEKIQRQERNLECFASKLPDKGKKIRDQLHQLEEEKRRRTFARAKMLADECEKLSQPPSSYTVGSSNGFENLRKSNQPSSQSAFGASFCKKLEENTDSRLLNTFEKSLSVLNHCEHQKIKSNGDFPLSERMKVRRSPRHFSLQFHTKPSSGDPTSRTATTSSHFDIDDNLRSGAKKDAIQVLPPNDSRSRQGETVVIVDEEEPQLVKMSELEVKLPNCKKDARIYYPSRYLQQQAYPTSGAICDYHVFNTYFYQELKEAVSYKGSDKDSLFVRFRRWWKGVNIFQKAYILIPINEE